MDVQVTAVTVHNGDFKRAVIHGPQQQDNEQEEADDVSSKPSLFRTRVPVRGYSYCDSDDSRQKRKDQIHQAATSREFCADGSHLPTVGTPRKRVGLRVEHERLPTISTAN